MSSELSIMPLVEENRRLHEEIRVLKEVMNQHVVQIDDWLKKQYPGELRDSIQRVLVKINTSELLYVSSSLDHKRVVRETLVKRLSEQLIAGPLILRTEDRSSPLGEHLFTAWFLRPPSAR